MMKNFPANPLFESFTLPIFDLNSNYDHQGVVGAALQSMSSPTAHGRRALYVHIPFCDTICSFCPFIKSGGTEKRINDYVDALIVELKTVAQKKYYSEWEIDNIYFGGGTPSVLSCDQFERIRNAIFQNFKIKGNAEFSVEAEVKSVTEEKVAQYAELGVTRMSWGVQVFDKKIRDYVNLTASIDQIAETTALAKKYLRGDNFDMIVGFPGQMVEDCIKEMEFAISLGGRSVSLYPFDYVTALPNFLDRIRSGSLPPAPSSEVRWQSFYRSREVLLSRYSEQNMYSFGDASAPDTECKYMFSVLYGTYFDETIGVGCGAYSSVMGLTYHNSTDEKTYVNTAAQGHMPISVSSFGHIYEKGLVYFPKRLTLSKSHYRSLDLGETYDSRLSFLLENEMISDHGDQFKLTEFGKLNYINIMIYMMSDHQRRLYERTCTRLSATLNWGTAGPAGLAKSGKKSLGVKNTLPTIELVKG